MNAPPGIALSTSASAALRQRLAAALVSSRSPHEPVLIVVPSPEAGARLLRLAARGKRSIFGWQTTTLEELAARLASASLASRGAVQVEEVVLTGLCARALHRLADGGALGPFAEIATQPGLPRALSRSFLELRMAGERLDPRTVLGGFFEAIRSDLSEHRLADRADVFACAAARVRTPGPHPLLDHPLILFDVALHHRMEIALVRALGERSGLHAFLPDGDRWSVEPLQEAFGVKAQAVGESDPRPVALERARTQLFGEVRDSAPCDETVEVFSAPGESRECVEILRRVQRGARDGVSFDRMAVLTHQPERYRSVLEEAFRRAEIPAYFARGTVRPDPTGRALLALLTCRAENYSARAFAEYLSLSVVPDVDEEGSPPVKPLPWVPPESELYPVALSAPEPLTSSRGEEPSSAERDVSERAVVEGSLRAPWRWERLLHDAAVVGGVERWRERFDALDRSYLSRAAGLDPDDASRSALESRRADLAHLAAFALPLLEQLAELPKSAPWGVWSAALAKLAGSAIRHPERILAVLRSLHPMSAVGPVGVLEVQRVLAARLTDMVQRPQPSAAGCVYVGTPESARGLSFDRVFVPGLAERMFPRKVVRDAILDDAERGRLGLATSAQRVDRERLALRLAVGAAERRLVVSYPRLDADRGRPRVPSFYGLELLRAIEGALPSFEDLASRAERAGRSRMAWPAPDEPADAIDVAEYDLAVLDGYLHADSPGDAAGAARYLVETDRVLARALRRRWLRWGVKWSRADGLVNASNEARSALRDHALSRRPYSATALESLAACPYRFYLSAICGVEPRVVPMGLESVDPWVRGTLMHDMQRALYERLAGESLLPVDETRFETAREHLDAVVEVVAARAANELAPTIERVWRDGISAIRADLVEWLRRVSERPDWSPKHFELAFGLPLSRARDAASVATPVTLSEGLVLRGAIDLVESRDGSLRATDHKSGEAIADGVLIGGGRVLQPLLYARALETLFPDAEVIGGRLHYCTTRGGFSERTVQLGPASRDALTMVVDTVGTFLDEGFFPAAPGPRDCERCDYRPVCGPGEETRVARKRPGRLIGLLRRLRKQP